MRKAAVIGSPVSHTKSPAIFAFLAKEFGVVDFQYGAEDVSPADLEKFLKEKKSQPDWMGLNVTIPHKEKVLSLLDQVSEDAKVIGAVNMIALQGSSGRSTRGFNTDVVGIQSTLVENHLSAELRGKNALVLGSGGAARAVVHVLAGLGAREILICNQNIGRAEALVKDFSKNFPETQFRPIASFESAQGISLSLVVNTTPLGMQGVTHAANGKSAHEYFSELSCLTKPEGALAFDLIYNPQDTAFMACARNHGFRAVGGLPMLVDQAMAAWDIWNEITESSEQDPSIRNRLLAHLREMFREEAKARTIFLTGFMGVGKSVVAAELGKKLKRSHVDTDRLIEQKAGLSISEIFSQMGEDYFRNLEKQTIIELAAEPGRVVALGGGALVNPESLAVVKKRGLLVFLDAEIEALDRRLQRTASLRPLLAGLTPDQRLEKMNNLLAERMPIYLQAEIQIKTDDHRPDEVADLILKKISENLAVSS